MGVQEKMFFNDSFQNAVKIYGNKTALILNDRKLTYDELDKFSDIIAEQLICNGVNKSDTVAIMIERSFEMIIAIIAVLKIGAAYLPIDTRCPINRVNFMLDDSNAKLLITNSKIIEQVSLNRNIFNIDNQCFIDKKAVKIDTEISNDDVAYIIYTSGTTGTPKGVMISHGGLINFINGITERITFDATKTILAVTTFCFDIFVLETLLPLTKGSKIVIADDTQHENPKLLVDLIKNKEINMLQMTPSRINMILNYDSNLESFSKVDTIMLGGEPLNISLLNKVKNLTEARIYNMYGPTETTVWSSIAELTNSEYVSIGKEILNTKIYILNEKNELVEDGDEGEICIAGDGLALGYVNRQDLTEERFIKCDSTFGERVYRTGDLGKRINNELFCIGRIDNQIKIRGFRVELEEIEKNILRLESVKDVIVICSSINSENNLVAFIVGDNIEDSSLKEALMKYVPYYMVPSRFINIDKIPITINGKKNRSLLKKMYAANMEKNKMSKVVDNKLDKVEQEVINVIDNSLEISFEEVNLDSMLDEIGVTSIKFIEIVMQLENIFNIEFDDIDLNIFKFKCIKNISDYVKSKINM